MRRKIDLPGQEEEVVVREPTVDARVHEVGHGESIGPFVAVEDVEGLRGIEDGVSVGGHGGGVGERLPVSAFFEPSDMLPQRGAFRAELGPWRWYYDSDSSLQPCPGVRGIGFVI